MGDLEVRLNERERQALILAIVLLSIERPVWDRNLSALAEKLGGRETFERLKAIELAVSPGGAPTVLSAVCRGCERTFRLTPAEIYRASACPHCGTAQGGECPDQSR